MKYLRLWVLAALMAVAGLAPQTVWSQTMTTMTVANPLKVGGNAIPSGTISFTPVNVNGTPIPFVGGDGSLYGPEPFICALSNGLPTGLIQADGVTVGAAGSCQVPNAALTSPLNVQYNILVKPAGSGSGFTMVAVPGITGASWTLKAPAAETIGSAAAVAAVFNTTTSGEVPAPGSATPTSYVLSAAGTWVAQTGSAASTPGTPVTCSSAYALAFNSTGDAEYVVTLSANCTLSFTTPSNTGTWRRVFLIIVPNGFQATLPASSSSLAWAGGTAPVPSTSTNTVITFGSAGTSGLPIFGGI